MSELNDTRDRLVGRTRFIFSAPSLSESLGLIVGVGLVAGVVAYGATPMGIAAGLVLFAVPAMVGTALTGPLDRARGGTYDAGKSGFTALVSAVIEAAFVVSAASVPGLHGDHVSVLLAGVLMGAAAAFAFRWFVLVSLSGPTLVDRVAPAVVQPAMIVLAAIGLAGVSGHRLGTTRTVIGALVTTAAYAGIVVGSVVAVDQRMRSRWGFSGFEFLPHFLENGPDHATALESLLAAAGERATVPVAVLGIRARRGDEKARIVVPAAHPGPFADVGGGTLPNRLADAGPGAVFVPHSLTDHSRDPATREDVDAIVAAAERALDGVTYESTATAPILAREGDATVHGQRFGSDSFYVTTFAPAATDDVSPTVGVDAASVGSRGGLAVITDAHNVHPAEGDGDGRTIPGSERSTSLVEAVDRAATALENASQHPVSIGVAAPPTRYGIDEDIGPLGVRALVIDVDGTTSAHVLIDGNNMDRDLREAVRSTVRDEVPSLDILSVSTTDTHAATRFDASGYVGRSLDADSFADHVVEVVTAATDDLEPVEVGGGHATATITVLGEGTVDEIAAFADFFFPVLGWFILLSSAVATVVSALAFGLV